MPRTVFLYVDRLKFFYISRKKALDKIDVSKATGSDRIPTWILPEFSDVLAAPLTDGYNSSDREGTVPTSRKTADIIPVPKKFPPRSTETDTRPISLTPIAAKVFESIVLD